MIACSFAQENAESAGSGLGLSMVRGIITMLQGEIDIKSIVNTGTIVTVTLRTYMRLSCAVA